MDPIRSQVWLILARLTGATLTPLNDGTPVPQVFERGVKLYFVAAPDQELAEFLRAQRANDTAGWISYLSRYQASSHARDAKLALEMLYVATGEASMTSYLSSVATQSPSYAELKNAKALADKAQALQLPTEQETKLLGEIQSGLAALVEKAHDELSTYNSALQAHAPGYVHLKKAREIAEAVSAIDLSFAAGQALLAEVLNASNLFDRALRSAESLVAEKQMENAIELVEPLRAF